MGAASSNTSTKHGFEGAAAGGFGAGAGAGACESGPALVMVAGSPRRFPSTAPRKLSCNPIATAVIPVKHFLLLILEMSVSYPGMIRCLGFFGTASRRCSNAAIPRSSGCKCLTCPPLMMTVRGATLLAPPFPFPFAVFAPAFGVLTVVLAFVLAGAVGALTVLFALLVAGPTNERVPICRRIVMTNWCRPRKN